MADEDVIRTATEEGQEEIENKGSFSYMMEHPDEAPDPATSAQDQETPEEKEAREAAEAEAAVAAGGVKEETPEEKVAREAAEVEAAAAAAKPKFATLEEWEKGYKEAETRMHTATGETAKEREAREVAEKRAEAAETKLAEKEAEIKRIADEAAKPKVLSEDEQDTVFENALSEIADLDRSDPDHKKQAAKIWRKAIASSGDSRPLPDPEKIAEDAATRAWEKIQAKQAEATAKTAEERDRENRERLNREASDFAKQAGLDMTPGSADYRLFWDIANNDLGNQEFMKGDNLPPPVEQFKWVTGEAKRLLGKKVEQTEAERKAAAAAQKRNTVMGKGLNFTPSKETPKTKTLSEMY